MPQEHEIHKDMKRNFNIGYAVCMMQKMALVLPMRDYVGSQTLGKPCVFAFILMLLWYMATEDMFLLMYLGVWTGYYFYRRFQTWQVSGRINSNYDGYPTEAAKFVPSEKIAKMVVEPIHIGVMGATAFFFYLYQEWRPTGLPYFLCAGVFTLPFTEAVKLAIWDRKVQGLIDARLDQEVLVEEYHNRVGR